MRNELKNLNIMTFTNPGCKDLEKILANQKCVTCKKYDLAVISMSLQNALNKNIADLNANRNLKV